MTEPRTVPDLLLRIATAQQHMGRSNDTYALLDECGWVLAELAERLKVAGARIAALEGPSVDA